MTFEEFAQYHLPALETDEVRFNVQIPVIEAARKSFPEGFHYWTLGARGHCATQSPGRPLLLGALDRDECRQLARLTKDHSYPGVIGSCGTAEWFVEEGELLGIFFGEIIPQRIYALAKAPQYPGVEGSARPVNESDEELLFKWIQEFHREALPDDLRPKPESIAKDAASGRYFFWTVDGEPVSVGGIVRRTKNAAVIGAVFTPASKRRRGYAGSVTAALSDRILAERRVPCLYTNLSNPYSNRCYIRIGFKPHCDSSHCIRRAQSC